MIRVSEKLALMELLDHGAFQINPMIRQPDMMYEPHRWLPSHRLSISVAYSIGADLGENSVRFCEQFTIHLPVALSTLPLWIDFNVKLSILR